MATWSEAQTVAEVVTTKVVAEAVVLAAVHSGDLAPIQPPYNGVNGDKSAGDTGPSEFWFDPDDVTAWTP